MDRPNTSSEGGLFELVARGEKDKYFMSYTSEAVVPFSYNMDTWPACLEETRQTQPLNMVDFGRTVEWEMDSFGDILVAASFTIELPTWLPIAIQPLNAKTVIADASGTRYGYTMGIGAFLFEQIQFYQDQVLLQEFSGEFLYMWTHLQGTLNQEVLALKEFGSHSGSSLDIQRNATPGKLKLRLPLIGCGHPDEGGLPFVALPAQKYRLRAKIRRLEDLVESSAGHIKPTPWTRSDLTSTDSQGNKTPIKPLTRENIGKPLITLETTQKYVRQDIQELLKTTANQIPFLRPFENMLSLDKADYSAVEKGEISLITKRIDGRHPAEGILISFHSDYYAEKNQLWNLVNPLPASASAVSSKDYYNTMKFLVAAKDRESDWTSEIWRGLSPYTKCEKCPGIPVSWISFTYGPGFGYRAPERRKPSGTLNFSKADRPTLWMDIQDTLPNSRGQKKVMLRATTIGWGIYRIEGQRGALFFGN
jgi:hypothetical protein